YFRYRLPSNWSRLAPLVVKNVPAVVSGPTKLNGPVAELLAATWNWTVVLVGVTAVQERVVQSARYPTCGLASFSDDTWLPEVKPVSMYALKPKSVVIPPVVVATQDPSAPLAALVTRLPPE